MNPTAFCDPNAIDPVTKTTDPGCPGSAFGNIARNKFYGPNFKDVDLSVFKNIPITERVKVQLRAEMFNIFNRINLSGGFPGGVAVGGSASPNFNTCNQNFTTHTCSTAAGDGFGMVSDTIGDFGGAPGIGPGEAFSMQLAIKIIF